MTAGSISSDRITTIISAMKHSHIIVVGDSMIDEYFWGDVQRISPEAPVPIVEVKSISRRLGGASNVIQNLSKLGVNTHLLSVCGNDDNGHVLTGMLQEIGCPTESLIKSNHRPTTVKTRIIARQQQVVRADRELIADLDATESSTLSAHFDRMIESTDGIIISDYGKGVISPVLITHIIKKALENTKFIAVDPKDRHIHLYKKVSIITPNLKEAHTLAGIPYHHCSDDDIQPLGWKIVTMFNLEYLLITLSERGMALFIKEGNQFNHLPTVAQKVFDVTGAGDTVISVFSAAMTSGATPLEAAFIANHAAGITIAQLGTASVSSEELLTVCGTIT